MTRCLGVDMRSISCYKEEQEILLVDQPIQIQKTKAWDSNDTALINHLLYSLKSRPTEIRDRAQFYKTLGIKYKKKWIDSIMKHDALYVETEYDRKLAIHRLVVELGIAEVFYRSKYCPSKFVDSIGVDENG